MSAPDFIDTNVLEYACDATDPRKRGIAQRLPYFTSAGVDVAGPMPRISITQSSSLAPS